MKTRRKMTTASKSKSTGGSSSHSTLRTTCQLSSEELESYKTAWKVIEEGELTVCATANRFGLCEKRLEDWCDRYDYEEPCKEPSLITRVGPIMQAHHSAALPKHRREKYETARELVLDGELTVYEAAKTYGLAESTLQNWPCRKDIADRIPTVDMPCASTHVKMECEAEINEECEPIIRVSHSTKLSTEKKEALILARQLVLDGKMTRYAAAKKYRLPKATLHRWCKIDDSEDLPSTGRPCFLTNEFEDLVEEDIIKSMSESGSRMTRKDLISQVGTFIKKHGIADDWTPGTKWINGFIKRHDKCKQLMCKREARQPKKVSSTPVKQQSICARHTTKLSAEKKEALILARQLVLEGKMTKYAAAKKYRLPQATLHRWCKRDDIGDDLPSVGRPCFLTNELESLMKQEILESMSTSGARMTRKNLVLQVKAFIKNHGIVDDWVPGKKWISGFIRRHETFRQLAAKGTGRPSKQSMDDFNHMIGTEFASPEFQMPTTIDPNENNQQHHQQMPVIQMQNAPLENTLLQPMEDPASSMLNPFEPSSSNLMPAEHMVTAPSDIGSLHASDINEQHAMPVNECANSNVSININEIPADEISALVSEGNENNDTETDKHEQTGENEQLNAETGKVEEAKKDEDDENGEEEEDEEEDEEEEEEEEREKEEEIDKDQCRICLSKENLVDIFKVSNRYDFRVSDLIMKICTTVKIGERDFLPHYVCSSCEDRVEAAYTLRLQCEESEKLLRSKLKRSKRTRRGPSEFVIIDAEPSSDSHEENQDDDEFHLSEVSEDSEVDSDMSYEEKRRPQARRAPRRRPPPKVQQKRKAPIPQRSPRSAGVVYIPATGSDDDGQPYKKNKPSRISQVFKCPTCSRICGSAELLRSHMQMHATSEKCRFCGKEFKHRPTLSMHLQKHNEGRICPTCHLEFATKNDCRRHMQTAHIVSHVCNICKHSFPSKGRLDTHKCESVTTSVKIRKPEPEQPTTGRDLFKSVAPLTTTYWSDSFSD